MLEQVKTSQWGTPLVPVPKPNGELRCCGDYKVTINKFLDDVKYPLPLIDEIFTSLQGGERKNHNFCALGARTLAPLK